MYTIRQASDRTGVSVPLLRAWERRYGVPAPERTASGYRLYGDEVIAQLKAMRQLVDDGWAPSQAAVEIRAGRLPNPSGAPEVAASAADAPSSSASAALVARIVAAAGALDEAAIEASLGEPALGLDFETVVQKVWLPALVAVGDAWESGGLDVASEHALSAAIMRRLGIAYAAAGRPGSHPHVLVGLPPGARHECGALAFAVLARRAGIDLLYLGADVPAESWTRAVAETGARVVVLGVATLEDRNAARDVVVALSTIGGRRSVLVGGPAAAVDGDLPAAVLPPDLQAAIESVRGALASAS